MKKYSKYNNILNVCIVTLVLTLAIAFIPINTTNSNQTDHSNTNVPNTPSISSNITSVPSAPQNLTYNTGNFTTLYWYPPSFNGSSGITQYLIYRGSNSTDETFLTAVGPSTLSYTDTAVTNGQHCYYKVAANNSVGIGLFSNEISVYNNNTEVNNITTAPQILTYTTGSNGISLSWKPPYSDGNSTIINYTIYRGSNSTDETFLTGVGPSTLSYTDTAVTNGTTYYYDVAAANSARTGPRSNEISATFNNITTNSPPNAPQNLTYTTGSNSIILSWDPPSSNGSSGITQYLIYRGTSSGQESYLSEVNINTLSFTDTAVTNGTTYYYEVAANNSLMGPFSNEICAILNNTTSTPSSPQYFNYTTESNSIILSWDPPSSNGSSAITNYLIYRGTKSGNETLLCTVGNVLTYNDTNVTNGQQYYYEVAAANSAGLGPFSNEICAILNNTTMNNLPSAPLNLHAIVEGYEVILTWDPPSSNGSSPIISYNIYCGNSSGNEVYILTINSTQTYYDYNFTTINGSEDIIYLKVSAINDIGEGPLSNECNVTLQNNPLINLKSINGISLGELISMGLIGIMAVVVLVKKKMYY